DRAIELWSPTPALATLYQQRGAAAGVPVASYTFTRSDHQAFLDRGMPAVGIGEEFNSGDHTPHYHKATDTFDKISFAYLGSVTRLAIDVIETSL
ncbi:MAG: M28 family peptidase, partial [Kofleriaceae bacterium]